MRDMIYKYNRKTVRNEKGDPMADLASLRDTLAQQLPSLALREGEPMSRHTTFRVGGPAALMALPSSPEELQAIDRVYPKPTHKEYLDMQ